MNADVNETNMEEKITYSTPISGNGIATGENTPTSHFENMDTTTWPPLDDHLQNLHSRGVSIHISNNNASAIQQQQLRESQSLDQRSLAYKRLMQQQQQMSKHNKISKISNSSGTVLKKTKSNKQTSKASNKRRINSLLTQQTKTLVK